MPYLKVELVRDIPEGWQALDAVSAVKCLNDEGELALCIRTSSGITPWEAVGMLIAASDGARKAITDGMDNHAEE